MLIIFITIVVALLAALSAIGVCERCKMESGGVYFLLSHVLGARIGASVGIIYCFGQVRTRYTSTNTVYEYKQGIRAQTRYTSTNKVYEYKQGIRVQARYTSTNTVYEYERGLLMRT